VKQFEHNKCRADGCGPGPQQLQRQLDDPHSVHNSHNKGDSKNSGSSTIDSIPAIPKLNFANTTNATTATVTIAVCDGIVPGARLDKNTGQIVP
jgi:hypothetical protein